MNTSSKYLILTVIGVIVCVAGYFTGKHLSDLNTSNDKNSFEAQKDAADYMAAVPSSGPIINTTDMDVTYKSGHAYGYLNEQNVGATKIGQDVILYDKEGIILPLGGIIESIELQNDQYKVTISLPEDTDTSLLMPFVSILTQVLQVGQRVPHSAVLTDDNGKTYIWVATPSRLEPLNNEDKFKLVRQYVEKGAADPNYVDVNAELGFGDLVVMDPDKKIKEDKIYKIFNVVLDAPSQNPIRQAYVDYEGYLFGEWMEELEQIYQDCLSGKTAKLEADSNLVGKSTLPDGTTTINCPTNAENRPATKEEILQMLLSGNNAAGGCGSSACGQ